MAKRRLSKQQQFRIRRIQAERTERAGKREQTIDRQLEAGELGDEQSGLIIAHYGQQLDVEAREGEHKGELFRCFVRANIDSLVTGDQVTWRPGQERTGVIVARNERQTLLQRPDNFGQLKPVAANIDHIILVIAPEPEPHDNLIDRYLVAAENTDIPAVILLNKADLLNDHNRAPIEALLNRYRDLGYPVVVASAHHPDAATPEVIDELVRNRTSVFVGQSGVGKSSIIQTLMPDTELKVGALSVSTGKGTHTTTTAKLFHLAIGGDLIDSPGIREFGLWHMTAQEIEYGFREIRNVTGNCRFRDCRHKGEPGCALAAAVEEGKISPQRLHSYQRILQSMEEQQARGLTTETEGRRH
ncbi:small ribosomal subunit biogenesis GTPase RsgA [uncultured Marinobacter sp.]|uniref:small ribosomal subunit biogenesis GTPase RsgA n=1 Tax=uncultured Marinobacter sp. TaxID=187379 RepID=UPI0030DCB872